MAIDQPIISGTWLACTRLREPSRTRRRAEGERVSGPVGYAGTTAPIPVGTAVLGRGRAERGSIWSYSCTRRVRCGSRRLGRSAAVRA